MIQDLGSHCYHNEYRPVPPRDNDYILFFHGRQALVKISGDTFTFPDFQYAGKYYPQVYTSYTYVINNKGDCLPADYFPICILNKKDKDYTEGLNILEKGVGAGYRLALVSNGDDTRCYLAHNEGTGARYTSYKHLRDDKISMLANLKKNKIEATPLNDNGLTTASYTRDTAISFDQEFQELKL